MNHRSLIRRIVPLGLAIAGLLALASPGSAQEVLELKPNLQSFPAGDLALVPDFLGGFTLRFSTTTWNPGDGPLELVAGETGQAQRNVYQRVYLDDGGYYDRLAGTFEWHPEHGHTHFEDYALYTLQPANAPGGSQRTSSKTTFCLIDTDKIDPRLPGAPKKAVYVSCNADFQGLSVGWGDTYGSHLPGQEIDFTGNPTGYYTLTIEADPKNRLLELNEGDNAACELLHIDVETQAVTVVGGCEDPGGDVVVDAIEPNAAQPGTAVDVTITGSGFSPGMGVTFENGSGPAPTASNVTVHDANTITATVTVKSGGPRRPRVWDLRVGSGVLPGGFTVLP